MTGNKAAVSLATGLEDAERVTVALLVAVAAAEAGRPTLMFLTKEAVRLATEGVAVGTACAGCPDIPSLMARLAAAGGTFLVCPICFNAKALDARDRSWPTPPSAARSSSGSGSAPRLRRPSATDARFGPAAGARTERARCGGQGGPSSVALDDGQRRQPAAAAASAGNGGGVPPNAGHSAWWSHQPHSRVLFGRKSPVATARSIAAQIACRVRSKRTSSASSGA